MEISTVRGYYLHFVKISTFRGYYLHFVDIYVLRGYYPHFMEVSMFRKYYPHFVEISMSCGYYLHFVDIIYIDNITIYLHRNVRPIFQIYLCSENDWYTPLIQSTCTPPSTLIRDLPPSVIFLKPTAKKYQQTSHKMPHPTSWYSS